MSLIYGRQWCEFGEHWFVETDLAKGELVSDNGETVLVCSKHLEASQ